LKAFLERLKSIHTIEEAEKLLWEQVKTPTPNTKKALALAKKAHEGQQRKSGEPYVVHPILVAATTAYFSRDSLMVQAALLHDVVEDTHYETEELKSEFGENLAHLVEGLTKIVRIRDENLIPSESDERLISSALSFRKMLIASFKDVRILVIKLCDRLHNMLTISALPTQKQRRIAEETLVVYAPIAHRLGISRIKNTLEDLCFEVIYPQEYAQIDRYIRANTQNLQFKLNAFIQKITQLILKDGGFKEKEFQVVGRVKHHYSIYMKMQRKGIGIEEVLDLLAVRVMLKRPIGCYRVLGIVHLGFTPLVSRFKDYIAVPKENGYQTIHTTLFYEEGIVEVQIRTHEMHQLAEYGVAAHWIYKSGNVGVNLEWLEGLHYQKESVEEFYALAKTDLFSEDITVFSPKGDYFTLPKGSVALDFAYTIHSKVGTNAVGALINKQEGSLLGVLKNGDIVRIIKDNAPHLYCSWIDSVKTSKAKEGIRTLCRAREKECNELSAYNILFNLFDLPVDTLHTLIEELHMKESIHKIPLLLDFFKETIHKLAHTMGTREVRTWELFKKGYKKPTPKTIDHLIFYSNKNIDGVEFDYCCHPKMGDLVVAFYHNNRAIVHHKLCKKAYEKMCSQVPMLHVQWQHSKLIGYRLIVGLQNRKGVLAELLTLLAKLDMNVTKIELGIQSSDSAEFCRIEVESAIKTKNEIIEKFSPHFKLIEITSLDDAYNDS